MNAIPRYRRRADAARYIRETWGLPCSSSWLAKLAVVGGGPIFRKAGRFPIYTDVDLTLGRKRGLQRPGVPPPRQHETARSHGHMIGKLSAKLQ
jgi:hypothetical protein